ncbi:2OG-Fe dioxygenase family protein [Serratia rubidaea]|uniref:2OG-Fe dioxygenase family protein n=1 Tax=Serratia rubidaea TaxID=61652 RepID=UPI003D54F41F
MENEIFPGESCALATPVSDRLALFRERHFIYFPACELGVGNNAVAEEALVSTWENLPVDKYLQGSRLRRRRICKFDLSQQGEITPLQDCHFFQSSQVNGLLGGIERLYPRSENDFISSSVVQQLLAHHHALLTRLVGNQRWLVTCHQLRVCCDAQQAGLAAPEGRHSDGHDYIFQHLIQRNNVLGGASEVYDRDGRQVLTRVLQGFLDTLLLDDRMMQHDVTPLYPDDPLRAAFRDMLIIDFDQIR